jgi:hypothetical protein
MERGSGVDPTRRGGRADRARERDNRNVQRQLGQPSKSGPSHEVTVTVTRVKASAAAIAYGLKKLRLEILGNGALVNVGSVASIDGKTSSCVNPPTEDCTDSLLEAIVKKYSLNVFLSNAPTGGEAEGSSGHRLRVRSSEPPWRPGFPAPQRHA